MPWSIVWPLQPWTHRPPLHFQFHKPPADLNLHLMFKPESVWSCKTRLYLHHSLHYRQWISDSRINLREDTVKYHLVAPQVHPRFTTLWKTVRCCTYKCKLRPCKAKAIHQRHLETPLTSLGKCVAHYGEQNMTTDTAPQFFLIGIVVVASTRFYFQSLPCLYSIWQQRILKKTLYYEIYCKNATFRTRQRFTTSSQFDVTFALKHQSCAIRCADTCYS